MKKIIFGITGLTLGGAERVLVDVANKLIAKYDVTIFTIYAGKKYSTVFRFSAVMKEKVHPKKLEKAVIKTLEEYKSFKVRMKAGFFWYYFEENPKRPIIEKEKEYPCKYINPRTNNNYQFKVTYFENKINIDIFHSLTDGNSGMTFFKEIIYNYLEIVI